MGFFVARAPTMVGIGLTLVQARATSTNTRTATNSPVTVALPNPTLLGNAIIVRVMSDTTVAGAPSIADNLSSAIWGPPAVSHVGNVRQDVFVGLNCPAGITSILVTHNGANPLKTQYSVYEFAGVAQSSAADVTSTGGAMTTTANGDLIFITGAQTTNAAITAWTAQNGFTMLNAQNYNASSDPSAFAQYMVQSAAGAITPSVSGASGTVELLAVALKAANAGTLPGNSIRIVNVQGYNFYGGSSGLNGPWTLQFPTRGNLVHLSWEALSTTLTPSGLSGMSDTAGNTYTTNGAVQTCPLDSSAGYSQQARGTGASASSTNAVTFTADQIATLSVSHVELYDVANFTSFDSASSTYGKQTAVSSTLPAGSITPLAAGELIINTTGIDAWTLSGVTGNGYLSDIACAPNFGGGGSGLESDDGFAHYYSGDTNAVTFTYNVQNASGNGVEGWTSYSSAYK